MSILELIARNRLALWGGIVLCIVVLLALATPLPPLQPPNVTAAADRFHTPFTEGHLLGTDHLGRDLLSRLLWGTRLSLVVGFSAAVIAAVLGSAIGIVAGYFGDRTDNLIMRGVDMLMAFPCILLALAIVAALGPGLLNAPIAVAAVNVPLARNIRGITVGIAHREFVGAAKLAHKGHLSILTTEVLPNIVAVMVIAMSTTVGWMIPETAGPSFLGLGSQPPVADLGSMLGVARSALITNPRTSVVPGLMIFVIVISINLLGDGVREALDPRLRSGALTRPRAATIVDRKGPVPEGPGVGVLDLKDLETRFHIGKRTYEAVNKVSLQVAPGECLGIIGESGSGKSVTALSVMGLAASPPASSRAAPATTRGRTSSDCDTTNSAACAATRWPISSRNRWPSCTR